MATGLLRKSYAPSFIASLQVPSLSSASEARQRTAPPGRTWRVQRNCSGRPVSLSHLIDEIWGEDPPARVEPSLQSYVARARRAGSSSRRRRP